MVIIICKKNNSIYRCGNFNKTIIIYYIVLVAVVFACNICSDHSNFPKKCL